MSKLSQLHAELSEQASELGFESLGEAEQAGYGVDWQNAKLISPEEQAHEAWLKEQAGVLADLRLLLDEAVPFGDQDTISTLERAIDFIERGEC